MAHAVLKAVVNNATLNRLSSSEGLFTNFEKEDVSSFSTVKERFYSYSYENVSYMGQQRKRSTVVSTWLESSLEKTNTPSVSHWRESILYAVISPDQQLAKTRKNIVHDTLVEIYAKSSFGKDADALKILYTLIETSFAQGNVEVVDCLLAEFEPEKVRKMIAVGVIRCTFRARTQLKSWTNCLARVAYSLEVNGLSHTHALRGLFTANGRSLLAKQQSV